MRITVRLIVSLVAVIAAFAYVSALLQVRQERAVQQNELESRCRLLADDLEVSVLPLMGADGAPDLQRFIEGVPTRDRLAGLAVYDAEGTVVAITGGLPPALPTMPMVVRQSLGDAADSGSFDRIGEREMHVYARPLSNAEEELGVLVIFHDASHVEARLAGIWKRTFLRAFIQTVLIAIVTLLVVRWSIVGPIAGLAEWMRQLRLGQVLHTPQVLKGALFAPLAREVETLARNLTRANAAAEEEARLRRTSEALWTPHRLRDHVRAALGSEPLTVVSNREPYLHVRKGKTVECIVPAGGLITALDPVLRASGGTWIAHGSGDGDWDVVDSRARIRVPPDDPQYTLKRVALTKGEEDGYYYGFANEGLWPLCHIAHTRPVFRAEDWEQYRHVNQKFADATLEEIESLKEPCVLVQDYHLALLPALLRKRRPDARIAIFWHIPWPNPESFGICPWQKELLLGMLGADLIGFHTQYHCNNFLDTVNRALESRIHWDRFAVEKEGHTTHVKPLPISVAFPESLPAGQRQAAAPDRSALLRDLGVPVTRWVGIGVERMDYTKGVLERFQGIERFLDEFKEYQGRFTFVQIAAPSRSHIKRYHDLQAEIAAEVERINWKFKKGDWRPIVFLQRHHSREEILPFYRAADLCMVTSLHDGMNLVAKEFVAAREDGGGVLILSRFAGAALELREALIVNPYDAEQIAQAIRHALLMPSREQNARMVRMRETVREHNIYRWAGMLIQALAQTPRESLPVDADRSDQSLALSVEAP